MTGARGGASRITTPGARQGFRIDNVVTHGTFSLDGGTWEVDNNVYVVGDDSDCLIVDAAHDADAILAAVGGRAVGGIVLTHAHDDHINVAEELARRTGAPRLLHPEDTVLWQMVYPGAPEGWLADGQTIEVAGVPWHVLLTPGHSPGGVCLYSPDLDAVLSGDTLFSGGPGATGRSFSSFDQIVHSIRTRLLPLPADTIVLTGHGDATTIGAEAASSDGWAAG